MRFGNGISAVITCTGSFSKSTVLGECEELAVRYANVTIRQAHVLAD